MKSKKEQISALPLNYVLTQFRYKIFGAICQQRKTLGHFALLDLFLSQFTLRVKIFHIAPDETLERIHTMLVQGDEGGLAR